MKVFFTATNQGEKEFGKYYEEIYKEIEELGYQHLDDDIVNLTYLDFIKRMEEGGREASVDYFQKKEKCIEQADICIFEVSVPTLALGFVTERSLKYGKPTIILYYKDNVPYSLIGSDEERLIPRSYDETNIKSVIREALDVAREKRDKRFNFFLSPKLLDYLEVVSKREGVTKSKLIRDMIVEHMRTNIDERLD